MVSLGVLLGFPRQQLGFDLDILVGLFLSASRLGCWALLLWTQPPLLLLLDSPLSWVLSIAVGMAFSFVGCGLSFHGLQLLWVLLAIFSPSLWGICCFTSPPSCLLWMAGACCFHCLCFRLLGGGGLVWLFISAPAPSFLVGLWVWGFPASLVWPMHSRSCCGAHSEFCVQTIWVRRMLLFMLGFPVQVSLSVEERVPFFS